jgi:hypothetical protein
MGTALAVACGGSAPTGPAAAAHSASPTPTATASPVPTVETPVPEPPPTPTPAPSLQVFVTQVDYGIVSVATTPGATCTASAVLSNGSPVAGLNQKRRADGAGRITWTYLQRPTTAHGGQYTVSCSAGDLQASATASFDTGN